MTAQKASLLKCSHCLKEFKYDSERRRHENSHLPQFQCEVCSKKFSFLSALRRHEKQHERGSTVTCKECGRDFRDDTLLKRHMNYAHAGSHTCSKCDSIFHSEIALRTHMKTHKAAAERKYQCTYEGCTKKFNFAHHLKHHELTHTNSKQHFCKVCGKGFIQAHHLKTHLRTHSPDSSLYCTFPDCNRKFATAYAKKRHVNKYHIKTDSGVSSDSNSAYESSVPSITKNEAIFEGDNIPPHAKLTKIEDQYNSSLFLETSNKVKPEVQDFSVSKSYKDEIEINDCEIAIGKCIMSDKGEKCVCVQIKNLDDYDFAPIETETINIEKLSIKTSDYKTNECCGGKCGHDKDNFIKQDDMPEIEYKTDGTVKIKEYMDVDIFDQRYNNAASDVKFVPFNSCKDVLGNCIVSGNGTMGEGCLCARMAIDDQVTEQEIDDITPQPNGGL